jgi:uncharacterized membrane protein YhaH (DUF805 family)
MKKQNNIYNYSIPKSGNEETSYFFTKGRITIYSFLLRLLFCVFIYSLSYFIFSYFSDKYWSVYDIDAVVPVTDEKTITLYTVSHTLHFYIVPVLLIIFVLIQGAKRMHDINKSGWYFLIPGYNIFLSFLNGTIGSNNYGIDSKPQLKVSYFDELEVGQEINNNSSTPKKLINNIGLVIIVLLVFVFSYCKFINNTNCGFSFLTFEDSIAVVKPEKKARTKTPKTEQDLDEEKGEENKLSENNYENLNFNGLPFVITPVKINPNPKGGSQNVFFDQNYTLFDHTRPNDPIFPVNKNGKIVYQIYYSSNEDPKPYYGEFTPSQLESHLYYKFKNKETCEEFCRTKKIITWQGQNESGFVTVFKKISSDEWIESNNDGNAYFYEVKNENENYTLKDKNRDGFFIYLTSDKVYYKDNSHAEWRFIYFGSFK